MPQSQATRFDALLNYNLAIKSINYQILIYSISLPLVWQ